MTGLDPDCDFIIQIATAATDINLNILEIGPDIVIFQEDSVLDRMNNWCKEHHEKSGLTKQVKASKTTTKHAEKITLDFIKKFAKQGEALPR